MEQGKGRKISPMDIDVVERIVEPFPKYDGYLCFCLRGCRYNRLVMLVSAIEVVTSCVVLAITILFAARLSAVHEACARLILAIGIGQFVSVVLTLLFMLLGMIDKVASYCPCLTKLPDHYYLIPHIILQVLFIVMCYLAAPVPLFLLSQKGNIVGLSELDKEYSEYEQAITITCVIVPVFLFVFASMQVWFASVICKTYRFLCLRKTIRPAFEMVVSPGEMNPLGMMKCSMVQPAKLAYGDSFSMHTLNCHSLTPTYPSPIYPISLNDSGRRRSRLEVNHNYS